MKTKTNVKAGGGLLQSGLVNVAVGSVNVLNGINILSNNFNSSSCGCGCGCH
jgi:hypothetical protein